MAEPMDVLGKINAIDTMVENFPASLLDLLHGPVYDNALDFIIDVLNACGVDVQSIIKQVLQEIFGFQEGIVEDIEDLYYQLGNLEIDENGKFFNALEYSVKGILVALLSSIFTCSAIPIIPNKYFDVGKNDQRFQNIYAATIQTLDKLRFPIGAIDPFDYLSTSPFSKDGKLYYSIEGGDQCFHKVGQVTETVYTQGMTRQHCTGGVIPLYFCFGNGHETYVRESVLDNHEVQDVLFLRADKTLERDLHITINFINKYSERDKIETVIKKGTHDSTTFNLTPAYGVRPAPGVNTAERDSYSSMVLSCDGRNGNYGVCVGNDHVYLSKSKSDEVINFWLSRNEASLSLLIPRDSEILSDDTMFNCPDETETTTTVVSSFTYTYEKCAFNDKATYYDAIPDNPTVGDSEYIIVHTGLTTQDMYQTYDMNAFLWYVMNRSSKTLQIEHNKTMWDSRRPARKGKKGGEPIERVTPDEWNEWYNSKQTEFQELSCPSLNDTQKQLYPILQCDRNPYITTEMILYFPAQTYFKPKAKSTDSNGVYKMIRTNTTLYEFNWQYLNSIQIFKPKLILYGMLNTLLGGLIELKNSISISFKKEEMRARLSSAIKKYITAIDTEVDDCYFDFGNDELDDLLEQMLLSRYNSTIQQSSTPTVHEMSIEDYISGIDAVNENTTEHADVQQIMKVITDVSATNGSEAGIDYGIELDFDNSWWKKVVMSLVMPIIESLFTPQVFLLILINFDIMGVTTKESLFHEDLTTIADLIINKIFSLIKSIIRFIMDKIKEILLRMVYRYLLPKIATYELLLILERLDDWIRLLKDVATCVPFFNFSIRKSLGRIDEVNYADIITQQSLPEANSNC